MFNKFTDVCVRASSPAAKLKVTNTFFCQPEDVELTSFIEMETFESLNAILATYGKRLARVPGRSDHFVIR